jgi:hypothetical protein
MDYIKDKAKKDKKVLVVTDDNDNTSNINLEDLMRKAIQRCPGPNGIADGKR